MGIPLRGRMASTGDITVNCATGDASACVEIKDTNGNAICAVPNASTTCKCETNYGAANSADGSACTKQGLTCAELNEKACVLTGDKCELSGSACQVKGSNPPTPTPSGIDCSAPTTEADCTKITGCAFVSNKCECAAGYGGADSKSCAPCKGSEYKAEAGSVACSKCAEGSYTAPANGSDSAITNTTGPNTQCIAAGSSSASPLAIIVICALIISIIASIATAAVMIRRKATNARAAEAIVSDAL